MEGSFTLEEGALEAKITSKGQITLPKRLRDRLGLKPGDKVSFTEIDANGVLLAPVRRAPLDALAGCLSHLAKAPPMTDEEQDEAIGKMLAEDDERITRAYHERLEREQRS